MFMFLPFWEKIVLYIIRRIRGGLCVGGTVRGTSRASGACERRARAAGEPASVLALAKTQMCLAGQRPPA